MARMTATPNYYGVFFDVRGHFTRGFIDASYTHSSSKDDALAYPTPNNPGQYYGPSLFDVPNRFSLSLNYSLKGLQDGKGFVGYLTGGWGISGTQIYQTGYPLTGNNFNSYIPVCQASGSDAPPCPSFANPAVGYAFREVIATITPMATTSITPTLSVTANHRTTKPG